MSKGKFHISQDGVVRPCTAQSPEACTAVGPTGEKSEHFNTKAEGEAYKEKVFGAEFGTTTTISRRKTEDDEDRVREIRYTLMDAETSFHKDIQRFIGGYSKEEILEEAVEVYDERTATVPWGRFDSFVAAYNEVHPESEEEFRGRILGNHVRHKALAYDDFVEIGDENGWVDQETGCYRALWDVAQRQIIEEFPEVAVAQERGEEIKKYYGPYRATGEVPAEAGVKTERVSELRREQNLRARENEYRSRAERALPGDLTMIPPRNEVIGEEQIEQLLWTADIDGSIELYELTGGKTGLSLRIDGGEIPEIQENFVLDKVKNDTRMRDLYRELDTFVKNYSWEDDANEFYKEQGRLSEEEEQEFSDRYETLYTLNEAVQGRV